MLSPVKNLKYILFFINKMITDNEKKNPFYRQWNKKNILPQETNAPGNFQDVDVLWLRIHCSTVFCKQYEWNRGFPPTSLYHKTNTITSSFKGIPAVAFTYFHRQIFRKKNWAIFLGNTGSPLQKCLQPPRK